MSDKINTERFLNLSGLIICLLRCIYTFADRRGRRSLQEILCKRTVEDTKGFAFPGPYKKYPNFLMRSTLFEVLFYYPLSNVGGAVDLFEPFSALKPEITPNAFDYLVYLKEEIYPKRRHM